jgi:hypothetical protein
MGAIMLIGAKSGHNHCLILCFLYQFCIKYEIISLTFGPSKIV